MEKRIILPVMIFCLSSFFICPPGCTQDVELYPYIYKTLPGLASPSILPDGTEVIISVTASGEYSVIPVTQEKGEIYSCLYNFNGKGNQTWIAAPDFPMLGKIGLHSEEELSHKTMITGRTVEVINFIARPNRLSIKGFIAEDEDIISVLKGDNSLVKKLEVNHAQLAKPLFHIWNAILLDYLDGLDTASVYYNDNKIFVTWIGCKGYQESIFHDEIEGSHDIHIWRNLREEELEYLKKNYSHLQEDKFTRMIDKLTSLNFSEMLPFYIMRYGFYEGHTDYRCDPIAIALVFGIKSLVEIDHAFEGNLLDILTNHSVSK